MNAGLAGDKTPFGKAVGLEVKEIRELRLSETPVVQKELLIGLVSPLEGDTNQLKALDDVAG